MSLGTILWRGHLNTGLGSIGSVLPNIYHDRQLTEFAAATDTPPLTATELARVVVLSATNFGLPVGKM